jgi:hypothetical protein
VIRALATRLADPPLDPSPDDARAQLRRELLKPEYHEQDVLGRIVRAIERWLDGTVDQASSAPPLSTAMTILVTVLLVAGLAALVSRARRTARATTERAVLTDERVTAAELRARARAAYDAERYEDAVVEGFRALTLGQVERGRLEDRPGATAHEVAVALSAEHPALQAQVTDGARLFDLVRYGEREATREQAGALLALDDALAGAR